MHAVRLAVVVVAAVLLSACLFVESGNDRQPVGDLPVDVGADAGFASSAERGGDAFVCFAAESDDRINPPPNRAENRVGLTLVRKEDGTLPPEAFQQCSSFLDESVELVDANGERIWLGVAARAGARALVPSDVLQLIDGAELRLEQQLAGFVPHMSLSITNGTQLIVAMEMIGEFAGPFGSLVVENDGASAPQTEVDCGLGTPLALRFRDDDDVEVAANGESVDLIVGGREVRATNIYTVDRERVDCDHAVLGVDATWVAIAVDTKSD